MRLTKEELKTLMEKREAPCVSLFMPTYEAGAETRQNRIRFKNLLREVEERMKEGGYRRVEIDPFLEPVQGWLEDEGFWQKQGSGLAVFLTPEGMSFYQVPVALKELVVVGERFHLKPLIPLFNREGRFFVLALSQNSVRLFEGTRDALDEMSLGKTPTSLEEALKYDLPERSIQFHTTAPGGRGGGREAVHHGQGLPDEGHKKDIARFLHQVNEGVHRVLKDEHAPLALACVEFLVPIYREANTYPHLLEEEWVQGNPERLDERTLHDAARALIEPRFEAEQKAAADRFRQHRLTDRAATKLNKVVPAAYQGRVDVLFTALDEQRWGRFEEDSQEIHLASDGDPGTEDLLDRAAVHTFLNGGSVFAVDRGEIPAEGAVLAALLRD